MAVRITVRVSGERVSDVPLTTREDMREVGRLIREQILRRTRQGLDAAGKPFAPYSPAYARQRAKLGKSGRVNLELSGAMLGDLQVLEVTEHSVTVGY